MHFGSKLGLLGGHVGFKFGSLIFVTIALTLSHAVSLDSPNTCRRRHWRRGLQCLRGKNAVARQSPICDCGGKLAATAANCFGCLDFIPHPRLRWKCVAATAVNCFGCLDFVPHPRLRWKCVVATAVTPLAHATPQLPGIRDTSHYTRTLRMRW